MKRWVTLTCPEEAVAQLAGACAIPKAAARVLAVRGIVDPEEARRFLAPRLRELADPFALPGMDAAVEVVRKGLRDGKRFVVFGDYDVDGVTATALLTDFLRRLGAHVAPFLPDRVEEGYGLGRTALDRCCQILDPEIIITVDCGTNSVKAVEAARAHGIEMVITDHHEPAARVAPADALINPHLAPGGGERVFPAGVGIAFKLAHGVLKDRRRRGEAAENDPDLREYMDLVALGTLCDMVPLRGENRVMSRFGLNVLRSAARPGLRALMDVSGCSPGSLDGYAVVFRLGPRINAAGRLGDAQRALDLLLEEDELRARDLAAELDQANRQRQSVELKIYREARAALDAEMTGEEEVIVAASKGWHPGVIGIVASRLVAHYGRPAVVIALDEEGIGRGSARSVEGFDIVAALEACGRLLIKYGGHEMAAGLEIAADEIDGFRNCLEGIARDVLAGRERMPLLEVDAWLAADDIGWDLMKVIEAMRPFGVGNRAPNWGMRGVRVAGRPRVVGRDHLTMEILAGGYSWRAIGFRMADREVPDGELDIVFSLSESHYGGGRSIEFVLKDIRAASSD